MSAQPEALRLADRLLDFASDVSKDFDTTHLENASNELRRQHALNAELLGACKDLLVCMELAEWENDTVAIQARAVIAKVEGGAATPKNAISTALADMGRAAL